MKLFRTDINLRKKKRRRMLKMTKMLKMTTRRLRAMITNMSRIRRVIFEYDHDSSLDELDSDAD